MGYGAFIKAFRERFGFETEKDLAKAIKMSAKQVSLWETDKAAPSMNNLRRMLALKNLTIAQCLCLPEVIPAPVPGMDESRLNEIIDGRIQTAIRAAPKPKRKQQGKQQGKRRA